MSEAPTEPTPKPSRTSFLLGLVRRLVDYGRGLATTLCERGLGNNPIVTGRPFGTTNVALILARIARGLLRAAALEARLRRNAARLDAQRWRYTPRPPAEPRPPALPAPRHTEADRRREADLRDLADDAALLAQLPTPEQIAAEVNRKPVGEVMADICRDLGMLPGQIWHDLSQTIVRERGNLFRLYQDTKRRIRRIPLEEVAAALAPEPRLPLAPVATGPP